MTDPPADTPTQAAPEDEVTGCFDVSAPTPRTFLGRDYEDTVAANQPIAIVAVGAIIPVMLVMTLLRGLVGEGIWRLWPLVAVALFTAGSASFWLTLWQSPKPIRDVSGRLLTEKAKKRLIWLSVANVFFGTLLGIYWSDLREALLGWAIPYLW